MGLARSAGGNSLPGGLRRLREAGELSVVHCPLVASQSEPPDPRTMRHSKRVLIAQRGPNNGQRTTDNAQSPMRREGTRTILGSGFVPTVLILLIYAVIFYSCLSAPEIVQEGHPQRELQIATDQGGCQCKEWRIHKDGSRLLAHVTLTALRDESGDLWGFANVTRDITEREQAGGRA
jgi:PAS domain-containing protein